MIDFDTMTKMHPFSINDGVKLIPKMSELLDALRELFPFELRVEQAQLCYLFTKFEDKILRQMGYQHVDLGIFCEVIAQEREKDR